MADIEITSLRNELRKKDEELLESKRQREGTTYKVRSSLAVDEPELMLATGGRGTSSQGGNSVEAKNTGKSVHINTEYPLTS